jgi:2-oxoglutarate dehydrogenase complex dehydrogenase (E1) component-like enzyme
VFFQDTDGYYNPINETFKDPNARNFIASNSHLSEFAVLGYELGYA